MLSEKFDKHGFFFTQVHKPNEVIETQDLCIWKNKTTLVYNSLRVKIIARNSFLLRKYTNSAWSHAQFIYKNLPDNKLGVWDTILNKWKYHIIYIYYLNLLQRNNSVTTIHTSCLITLRFENLKQIRHTVNEEFATIIAEINDGS